MNLAHAWDQTGCSLPGWFLNCIFADSRPDFQRSSRPAFQALRCQVASQASHRSRNRNDWMGTKLLQTSQTNWLIPRLADIPVTEVETPKAVLLTHSNMNFSACLYRDGRCKKGPPLELLKKRVVCNSCSSRFLYSSAPSSLWAAKRAKVWQAAPESGLCGKQHEFQNRALWTATRYPHLCDNHGQTSRSLGSRGWWH